MSPAPRSRSPARSFTTGPRRILVPMGPLLLSRNTPAAEENVLARCRSTHRTRSTASSSVSQKAPRNKRRSSVRGDSRRTVPAAPTAAPGRRPVRTDRYRHRLAPAPAVNLRRLPGICQTAATAPPNWATNGCTRRTGRSWSRANPATSSSDRSRPSSSRASSSAAPSRPAGGPREPGVKATLHPDPSPDALVEDGAGPGRIGGDP